MNVIELEHVSLSRKGKIILEDVSWTVPARQHCVLLGTNGSGKTALLQVVIGYLSPSSGQVRVLGKLHGTCDLRELRKSIGWVSSSLQERIHAHDTALEVVVSGKFASVGIWEDPASEDFDQAYAQLEFMGCGYVSERPYAVLSQGEKQRVLIARSLMLHPQLLILDEPCSGLDPASREFFLEFIEKLGQQQDGPTLIYVTHHIEEIVSIFSHVQLMRSGRMLMDGPKTEIITTNHLSRAFGMEMKISRSNGRYWVMECQRVSRTAN
ncbi:MAG: ABC transporter ATP-binding protein [Candidatus Vecturithrix sp.]|jgi:iron complex transport system ATP-binding protein|nr:ABC transporter ATP-binding protein [Candidatus Vecturithrix sp.]